MMQKFIIVLYKNIHWYITDTKKKKLKYRKAIIIYNCWYYITLSNHLYILIKNSKLNNKDKLIIYYLLLY